MKDTWKCEFRPVILQRGEDYWMSGNVEEVTKTSDGYHAVVYGSHEYDVDIEMDGDEVFDDVDEGEEVDEWKIIEAEEAGFLDGGTDARFGSGMYQSYGMTMDEDEMSEEEKQAYEEGYLSGYQMGE